MEIDLLIALFGTAVGIFAGLLSGIAAFASMLIFYPILAEFEAYQILLFYTCLIATSQYVGSVVAIYLGIPGESTSMPAVIEGRRLYHKHIAHIAITNCAIGSFIGGMLALGATWLIMPSIMRMFEVTFSNDFRFLLFFAVIISIIVMSNRNLLVSIIQVVLGAILGLVGVSPWYQNTTRFTFGITELEFGIPAASALFAVFVLPIVFFRPSTETNVNVDDISNFKKIQLDLKQSFAVFARSIGGSLRGTFFGYFLGLVPSAGAILASNFSYSIEKKMSKRSLSRITAAETANNAAVFTQLLPLIVVGIPIVGSEVVVYELMTQKGFEFGMNHNPVDLLMKITPWLILVNGIMLILSWPLSRKLLYLYKIPSMYIKAGTGLLIAYTIYFVGESQGTLFLHVASLLALLPLGWLFRNYNTLPFVVSFLLAVSLEGIIIRQLLLHGLGG